MDEYRSRRRDRPLERQPHPTCGEGIQFLLGAEEQILQSISARAPLPEVLNGICSALNSQIGNVVSLISLPGDAAANDLAAIAKNAALLGLYSFCSENVLDENGQLLGSLEMYCCVPRNPSFEEFQWIERATCLAAIAITRDTEASQTANGRIQQDPPVRGNVHARPAYEN